MRYAKDTPELVGELLTVIGFVYQAMSGQRDNGAFPCPCCRRGSVSFSVGRYGRLTITCSSADCVRIQRGPV